MTILSKKLILLIALVLPFTAHSELYKWIDEDGNVSYSDQPPFKGANTHAPAEINTTPAIEVPKVDVKVAPESAEADTVYKLFRITAPVHNETIRDNQGNISISLSLEPPLNTDQGHYIDVLMDNKVIISKLSGLSGSLSNIDRGTHQISAQVKNKQGKTLISTEGISLHLRRHSILNPKPQ